MISTALSVFELRQYTLYPQRRDELIELFEREFVEPQEAAGIALIGLFRDARRPDRFVWIRAFSEMESRRRSLEAFYGGPTWKMHRDAANATMLDSDNVLLLRPVNSYTTIAGAYRGPLLAVTYLFSSEPTVASFLEDVFPDLKASLERHGGTVLVALTSEYSENTFPRLPVREGEHAVVLLLNGIEAERMSLQEPPPRHIVHLVPTPRSRIQPAHMGTPGDCG
jgi:hypothetical protein